MDRFTKEMGLMLHQYPENFWYVFKRGLYDIYHQVSDKHLEHYLDKFAAKFNTHRVNEQFRFEKFLADSESTLNYKR